jgi:hypothetical protein
VNPTNIHDPLNDTIVDPTPKITSAAAFKWLEIDFKSMVKETFTKFYKIHYFLESY